MVIIHIEVGEHCNDRQVMRELNQGSPRLVWSPSKRQMARFRFRFQLAQYTVDSKLVKRERIKVKSRREEKEIKKERINERRKKSQFILKRLNKWSARPTVHASTMRRPPARDRDRTVDLVAPCTASSLYRFPIYTVTVQHTTHYYMPRLNIPLMICCTIIKGLLFSFSSSFLFR